MRRLVSRTPPSAPSADLAARTSPLWPRSPSCIAGPTCASPPTTLRGGADGHAPPRRAGAGTLRLGPPAKYPRQPCSRLPSVGDRTVVASVVIAPSPPLAGEPRCPTRFQPSVRSSTPAQAARLPPCVQIRSGNASSSPPHCFACLVTTTTGPPGAGGRPATEQSIRVTLVIQLARVPAAHDRGSGEPASSRLGRLATAGRCSRPGPAYRRQRASAGSGSSSTPGLRRAGPGRRLFKRPGRSRRR